MKKYIRGDLGPSDFDKLINFKKKTVESLRC